MKNASTLFVSVSLSAVLGLSCACANPQASSQTKIDPATVEKGKQTYAMFCQACHGPEDPTVDSPSNLFDKKWYHGEGRSGVEKSIRDGIMEKGMPGWGPMIPSEDIDAILDYLFSFQTIETSTDE
ncbi:c-type cytochrome [Pelagicoccus sp. SDUM812002]|uniref:c-type cytochrome n=1 Tax=Pelagicoccus sp. SDUM812002 TaxID=3041266 RepID=UPI00280E7DF3|nr:c-type cytochrome [Pelagicoccus sp. SDUM812002]MDQ8185884.1 c-type cytochrome [Pelagicoccus sp. SDUM812002]